jgi:hypothetical protein
MDHAAHIHNLGRALSDNAAYAEHCQDLRMVLTMLLPFAGVAG